LAGAFGGGRIKNCVALFAASSSPSSKSIEFRRNIPVSSGAFAEIAITSGVDFTSTAFGLGRSTGAAGAATTRLGSFAGAFFGVTAAVRALGRRFPGLGGRFGLFTIGCLQHKLINNSIYQFLPS
jgi:hypothetical protein